MTKASTTEAATGAGLSALKALGSRKTSISVNGNEIVRTKKSGSKTRTNYNQSEDEKNLMDYTNKNLLNGLENINVFSDEQKRNIQNQIDAYTQQGLRILNDNYTPMFRDLKADIASRFGNFDNSIFMDNLNDLEKNRTNALEQLTENILAKQSEIYEQEMNNRYNYLDKLLNVNQNLNSNMFNFIKAASGG